MSIQDAVNAIYLDNSILGTYQTCQEKARIRHQLKLVPKKERLPLSGGHAMHAALATYVKARDVDHHHDPVALAKAAFLEDLRQMSSNMPLAMDDVTDERRTVERFLNLLEAYDSLYRNEPYKVACRPDNNEPFTELGFAIYTGIEWEGKPIMYVGRIDCIKRSSADGRYYVFEHKTTTLGLGSYLNHTRPNHQITGYILAARELLSLDVAGCYWDCIYISDRQPAPKKGGWFAYGIDIEKDFGRSFTDRSNVDFEEFLFDIRDAAVDYLEHTKEAHRRWRRNASACFMYGGCEYRELCGSNLNPNRIESDFQIEDWVPYDELKVK